MLYDLEGLTPVKTSLLENCYSGNVLNILCMFSCRCGSYEQVTQTVSWTPPAVV